MSTIHSSWTLLGCRSLVNAGTARFNTVRSIAYSKHGRARTPSAIHSRRPAGRLEGTMPLSVRPGSCDPAEPVEDATPAVPELISKLDSRKAALHDGHPRPAKIFHKADLCTRGEVGPVRHGHRGGVNQPPRPFDHFEHARLPCRFVPRGAELD